MKKIFVIFAILLFVGGGCNWFSRPPEENLTPNQQLTRDVLRQQEETLKNRNTEQMIQRLIMDQYSIQDASAVRITVDDETLNHVRGRVELVTGNKQSDIVTGVFYASDSFGDWLLSYDGKGPVPCRLLEEFNFPERMRQDCFQVPIPLEFLARFRLFFDASINDSICVDQCGNGACEELVCQGSECPCAETKTSCAKDCRS